MIAKVVGIVVLICVASFAVLFGSALYGIELPALINRFVIYVFGITLALSVIMGGFVAAAQRR